MNYRDVALLNSSIDDLGRSLLQKKMMEEEKSQRMMDRDFRERSLEAGLANQERDNTRQDEALRITKENSARSADDQVFSRINGLYATFAKGVQDGYIDADMANAAMKDALTKLPQDKRDSILSNTPLGLFTSSGGFKPKATSSGMPTETKIEGGRILYNEGRWQFLPDGKKPEVQIKRDGVTGTESVSGTESAVAEYDARKTAKANPKPAAPGSFEVGGITIGNPTGKQGKPLDAATAKQFLEETGGDKDKARALARQRGYSF